MQAKNRTKWIRILQPLRQPSRPGGFCGRVSRRSVTWWAREYLCRTDRAFDFSRTLKLCASSIPPPVAHKNEDLKLASHGDQVDGKNTRGFVAERLGFPKNWSRTDQNEERVKLQTVHPHLDMRMEIQQPTEKKLTGKEKRRQKFKTWRAKQKEAFKAKGGKDSKNVPARVIQDTTSTHKPSHLVLKLLEVRRRQDMEQRRRIESLRRRKTQFVQQDTATVQFDQQERPQHLPSIGRTRWGERNHRSMDAMERLGS